MKPKQTDRFEEDVLKVVQTDKTLHPCLFSYNLSKLSENKCFIKTKFHNILLEVITLARKGAEGNKGRIVGIQGLGKSTSALYYVLSCRKNGDYGIHYVDLTVIEKNDQKFEEFVKYSSNIQEGDCVLLDHVTLLNMKFVKRIEEILGNLIKIILIETGFTACIHRIGLDFDKNYQLDREDFLKIWTGTMLMKKKDFPLLNNRISSLIPKGNDVYCELSKKFIITPRILHQTVDNMLIFRRQVHEITYATEMRLREDISSFRDDVEKSGYRIRDYKKFIIHTKVLLDCFNDTIECLICTPSQATYFKIAINIFDLKLCKVTKSDLEEKSTLLDLDLEEGDSYVEIRHLVPCLRRHWKENLPFELQEAVNDENLSSIVDFSLENGALKKRFENLLVEIQAKYDILVLPYKFTFGNTVSREGSGNNLYEQCVGIVRPQSLVHLKPGLDMLEGVKDVKMPKKYEPHLVNVFRVAVLMKLEIENQKNLSFIVHPQVERLSGFDYFVYTQLPENSSNVNSNDFPGPSYKRQRTEGILYAVRIATGETHSGNTMGSALSVLKDIIPDINIHVIVMIAKRSKETYKLTGHYNFQNVSVVNLGCPHISNNFKSYNDEFHFLLEALMRKSK